MLGHRKLSAQDYLDILKRRSVMIGLCAIVSLGIGLGVSYLISPVYESQTLILTERQQVPSDYVKPVVAEDLDARLASMKEQILSRSRLEPIITHYNLFAGEKRTIDDRIALTRKAIKVTQIQASENHGRMPGFFVAFDASDARTAQLVCGEITSLFVSANLNAQEQSAEGTTEFLRQQLSDAKAALDSQDAKLAEFEKKYLGRLPDQESSNANELNSLTTQLDAATQSINQLQQNEAYLESTISQETRTTQRGVEPSSPAEVDERERELQTLIDQKKQLLMQYTADYPDVVAVSRRIAELKAQISQSPAKSSPKAAASEPRNESTQLRQSKAQLRAVQQSLATARQEQGRIQQRIHLFESRLEQSPAVEQEYKQITRDHQTAQEFYNSLLAKMNESSMATALQLRQQGEQFTVMDPPNLPESPKFPNHRLFGLSGLMAGLVLGVLIAAVLEYRDTSLRSATDIGEFTNLPVLAVISYVEGLPRPRDLRSDRKFLAKKRLLAEGVDN